MAGGPDDWMLIGRVSGAHGVRGEVRIAPLTDFPDRFNRVEVVYIGDERERREVERVRSGERILLKLRGVTVAIQLTAFTILTCGYLARKPCLCPRASSMQTTSSGCGYRRLRGSTSELSPTFCAPARTTCTSCRDQPVNSLYQRSAMSWSRLISPLGR